MCEFRGEHGECTNQDGVLFGSNIECIAENINDCPCYSDEDDWCYGWEVV